MVGYYHVVNRGMEQRIVYKDDEDFETFLELLCDGCWQYGVKLHDYVLNPLHPTQGTQNAPDNTR